MRRSIYIMMCMLMLAGAVHSGAQDRSESTDEAADGRRSELRVRMLGPDGPFDTVGQPVVRIGTFQRQKNPSVGILLSAVLPGAGEIYAGKFLKGAVLIGVEAALWIGYVSWQKKGSDLETEFQEYADTHWSEERWLQNKKETDPDTHTLPDTKTQQYYEMIGKYDQFMAGWDDYYEGGPALTPNRDTYEHMRDDSNTYFKKASYSSMFAIANRLFAVFDTAFTIRRVNRLAVAGLRMGWMAAGAEPIPSLCLHLDW